MVTHLVVAVLLYVTYSIKFRVYFFKQQAAWHSESTDRTVDWVFQQKSGPVPSASSSVSPHREVSAAGQSSGLHHGPWRTVDRIVGKLHLISSKVRSMANKTTGR